MSKEFRYVDQEALFPNPTSTLRPHHLSLRWVQQALSSQIPPSEIAKKVASSYGIPRAANEIVYFNDLVGKSEGEMRSFQNRLKNGLATLRNLSDTDALGIIPEKDPICNACIVGAHCQSSNYISINGSVPSMVASENKSLTRIQDAMVEGGFKENTHYIISEVTILVRDRGGKGIQDPIIEEREEKANSMVALVGPIRSLIRKCLLPAI